MKLTSKAVMGVRDMVSIVGALLPCAPCSAYNKGEVDYIIGTTHPDNSATEGSKLESGKVVSTFKQDVEATCKKVR